MSIVSSLEDLLGNARANLKIADFIQVRFWRSQISCDVRKKIASVFGLKVELLL